MWSLIELNVAIICTCLPALRALGGHLLPEIFRASNKGTQYCYSQKNQGVSRGTKTPSHLNENFITMPESLIEDNYCNESAFRNAGALRPTRPLSVPSEELELVKTRTQARDNKWKPNVGVELGVGVWNKGSYSQAWRNTGLHLLEGAFYLGFVGVLQVSFVNDIKNLGMIYKLYIRLKDGFNAYCLDTVNNAG